MFFLPEFLYEILIDPSETQILVTFLLPIHTVPCFAFTVSLIATNPLLTCCVLTLKYPQHLLPPLTLSSLPDCHPTEDCDNKSAVNGKDIGEQAQSVSLC